MSRLTFTRQDCAEIWLSGLTDSERRTLVEQFEALHGGPGIAPPSPLELWDEYQAGRISLGDGTTSLEP